MFDSQKYSLREYLSKVVNIATQIIYEDDYNNSWEMEDEFFLTNSNCLPEEFPIKVCLPFF